MQSILEQLARAERFSLIFGPDRRSKQTQDNAFGKLDMADDFIDVFTVHFSPGAGSRSKDYAGNH